VAQALACEADDGIVTVTPSVRTMSWIFGFLIGAIWMAEILVANLSGTSVFGNLNEIHPRVYATAPWLALGAVALTALGGLVAAYRTGSIGAALRVGVWSGLISGAIALVTILSITLLFHDAMMKDPSNVHEFARSAYRSPTEAELSNFLYTDALAGGVNHIWIGPVLGLIVGGSGALIGKSARKVMSRSRKTHNMRASSRRRPAPARRGHTRRGRAELWAAP
jgi:hypothetical protein